ncbi:MAG TPA: hypothetical protein VKA10_06280, partial [Prolixibacteraceae bacterium]|nr:hypothetical protein [Prolixibacteraceae bacterium]
MPIENIAYILTFVVTAGITVLGILSSYNLFQAQKKPELQLLLYQQIFLFSFFIYGIWGNIAIRETISGLDIPAGFSDKLTLL